MRVSRPLERADVLRVEGRVGVAVLPDRLEAIEVGGDVVLTARQSPATVGGSIRTSVFTSVMSIWRWRVIPLPKPQQSVQ